MIRGIVNGNIQVGHTPNNLNALHSLAELFILFDFLCFTDPLPSMLDELRQFKNQDFLKREKFELAPCHLVKRSVTVHNTVIVLKPTTDSTNYRSSKRFSKDTFGCDVGWT